MKSKKTLIGSIIVIALCLAIIGAVTFALLADSIDTRAHLRAGALDIILIRTDLEYRILDENGRLIQGDSEPDIDFTTDNKSNVFTSGIPDPVRIAPNSFFEATLEIGHGPESNVAFDYTVGIDLNGTSNELAEQIEVIVTGPNNVRIIKRLSEFKNGATVAVGSIDAYAPSEKFVVRVEFLDDMSVDDDTIDNNLSQSQDVQFDLYVKANQPDYRN